MGVGTRLAAWLVTGPIGHLVAGLADLAVLVWTLARARVRARVRPARDGLGPPPRA